MTEENPFVYKDLLLIYIFVCGVISGFKNAAEVADYGVLNKKIQPCNYRYVAYGFGVLLFALLSASYLDWWTDRMMLVSVFVIPIIAFVVGGLLKGRNREIALFVVACVSAVAGLIMFFVSRNGEYYVLGYYTELITNNVVDKSVFYAFWIIPVAVIIGIIWYVVKINKWLATILTTIITTILLWGQIKDGRLAILKEAIRLQLNMEKNMRWILSKENYAGITSSHNMYMDIARDYGVITFGLIIAFELIAIVCFFRMLMNKNKTATEYILIVAFILFNYHFMLESTAVSSKYIFSMGLFIYGMVYSSAAVNHKETKRKWVASLKK